MSKISSNTLWGKISVVTNPLCNMAVSHLVKVPHLHRIFISPAATYVGSLRVQNLEQDMDHERENCRGDK